MTKKILLASKPIESLVNGEGFRYVIFAQICKHHCKGCFNPSTHSSDGGKWVEIEPIIQKIRSHPLIDGVTFSGGDPFEQPEAFYEIGKAVQSAGLSLWCYTGYTFEYILSHLEKRQGWKDLLSTLDVLVDGPFIEELADPNLLFRGSSNQRILDIRKSLKFQHPILYLD